MIPLLQNIGYAEISSAGTLNDAMGSAKSKLPIQFFKLTDNISGNLTLSNDSAHKKIILDTNGKTITNSSGSPLTINSSTTLELKGSGNIQSTLKTSTAAVSSTSNTGTTVFSNTDSSQVVVSNVNTDTTVEKYIDNGGGNFAYNGSTIDSSGTITVGGSTPNAATIFGSGSSTAYGINTTDGNTAARFIGDTATSSGSPVGNGYELYIATIGPNTVSQLRMDEYANIGIGGYSGSVGGHNRYSGTTNHRLNYSGTRRLWWRYVRSGNNRTFVFTNNLAISCVLSGADPFNNVTVSAGATSTITTTNSTDGSFNITATISGNNGSSQPFALVPSNNGTGSINTDAYTGTLSVSAL
jgi:hypothetical protein